MMRGAMVVGVVCALVSLHGCAKGAPPASVGAAGGAAKNSDGQTRGGGAAGDRGTTEREAPAGGLGAATGGAVGRAAGGAGGSAGGAGLPQVEAPPAEGTGPQVVLTSPVGGWSSERIVTVAGTIADTSLTRATLVVNGAPKGLTVSGGSFSTPVVLGPGMNTLQVVARNTQGVGTAAVSLFNQVPPKDMTVVLTWDTDGTDVDLHVVDPTGTETYYGNRNNDIGANLDQDVTSGYGPETFTLANAIDGTYEVRAKYYSDNGKPQTFVRVDVILYEGTDREERLTFRGVLEKTDEVVHIASFTLPR